MKKFTTYDIVSVGLMTAIVFVLSYFIKIPIPTPAGDTMLKVANAFCLLGGILFGGVKGGLAAGLGSMLYDFTDPRFISSAPTTFVFFFIMAFICGTIANYKISEERPLTQKRVTISAACGACSYFVLYIVKSIASHVIAAQGISEEAIAVGFMEQLPISIVACVPKMITSGTNVIIAIVITSVIALPIKKQLSKLPMYSNSTSINVDSVIADNIADNIVTE